MSQPLSASRPALVALFLFGSLPYISTIKWPPIASFWAEWVAAILAAAVVILLAPRRSGNATQLRIPLAAIVCLAAALVIAVQLMARQPTFRGAALLAVAELTLAAILCTSASRVRARGSIARPLDAWAFGLLAALLLNGLEVLAERNGWQVYLYRFVPRALEGRALGLFGQPNQLAVFSAMAWCGAQYLWMRGRLSSMLLLGAAALAGLNDAGAASRAGAILFVVSTLLGGWVMHRHAERRRGRHLLLFAAALFLLMQLWWTATDTGSAVATTILRSDSALRIELLRDAFALAWLHPLGGVGFGNFCAARWRELSWPMGEPLSGHAHNVIAQLAAELGVVGALLIILPATYVVVKSLRAATQGQATPEQFFTASVVLVLAGYSLTEYPLWYSFFLFPFAFVLGLVEQPGIELKPVQTEYMNVLRRGAWAVAFLGAVALAWDYRRIEVIYVDATIQQQAVTSRAQMTLELPTPQIRQIALLTTFDLYADLMMSRTLALNGRLMADKLPITERVMYAFPTWETVFRHIAFLVGAGRPDEARAVWEKTQRDPLLRSDTYDALKRQAHDISGMPAFVASLPKPVSPSPQP